MNFWRKFSCVPSLSHDFGHVWLASEYCKSIEQAHQHEANFLIVWWHSVDKSLIVQSSCCDFPPRFRRVITPILECQTCVLLSVWLQFWTRWIQCETNLRRVRTDTILLPIAILFIWNLKLHPLRSNALSYSETDCCADDCENCEKSIKKSVKIRKSPKFESLLYVKMIDDRVCSWVQDRYRERMRKIPRIS